MPVPQRSGCSRIPLVPFVTTVPKTVGFCEVSVSVQLKAATEEDELAAADDEVELMDEEDDAVGSEDEDEDAGELDESVDEELELIGAAHSLHVLYSSQLSHRPLKLHVPEQSSGHVPWFSPVPASQKPSPHEAGKEE